MSDIAAEFVEWATRNNLTVPDDDEDDEYCDLWVAFLEDEYNDQRKHPELFPI